MLEVVIKWSLNCAKGSASLAAPGLPRFCRCRLGLEWVMDEESQAHLSGAGIWALLDCGNSRRRSERETVRPR